MRILVTGSLGVLGRPLVAELRERGHEVFGLDRRHSNDEEFRRADVAEIRQLGEAFDVAQPDAVYHLAAEFGRHNGEEFYEDLWRTAAVGTRNVLECCDQWGSRLIFASSSEVYGDLDLEPLKEDSLDERPVCQPNEYALSKWANECQIRNYDRRYHLAASPTILRFFNAYGPGEAPTPYRSVVSLFCDKALRGERLPVFEGYHRAFMYVEDFTPTLANVCERKLRHLIYNIGGNDYRSVGDLAAVILGEIYENLDEENLGDLIESIPEDEHNVRSKLPDITRAYDDLDHRPTTELEDGIPPTLDWLRRQNESEEQRRPDSRARLS